MLPQEVRSLGKDREIVFTEDTPPILCRKIRYYRVPALRNRIRKPPLVPTIELRGNGARLDPERAASQPANSSPVTVPVAPSIGFEEEDNTGGVDTSLRVHEASVEDVDRAETLTLEDFETDFSRLEIPEQEGLLTAQQMQTAVADFIDTLKIGGPDAR